MLRLKVFESLPVKIVVMEDEIHHIHQAVSAVREYGLDPELIPNYQAFDKLNEVILGVLTDVDIVGQPEGLGLALQCLKKSIPVCVVTRQIGHEYSGWKGPILDIIRKAGIPVFISHGENKDWTEAMIKLGELIHEKLMAGSAQVDKAYQRYVKYAGA